MSNQLSNAVLVQSRKNFNKTLKSIEPQNNKLRSKSVGIQKVKGDQQNSILKLKKYEKQQPVNVSLKHRISAQEQFQKKNRQEIQISRDKQSKRVEMRDVLFDLCELDLKQKNKKQTTGRNDLHHDKEQGIMSGELKQVSMKGIKTVVQNQNGLLCLDNKGKVYFRQVNNQEDKQFSNRVNQFFETQQSSIAHIFSTPYSLFFVDKLQDLYGMGLNDRGQLGISPLGFIDKPTRIPLFTQLNKNGSKFNQSLETNRKINKPQKVTKIVGGPFHTVILTNLSKVYYSGNLYGENELINDEFINNFKEIKIKNETITDIQCGITSVVFRTLSNKIYVMGLYAQNNFYATPTLIQFIFNSEIKQIAITSDSIYVVSQKGSLYQINMKINPPIINEIKIYQLFAHSSPKNEEVKQSSVIRIFNSFGKIILVIKSIIDVQKIIYQYLIQIPESLTESSPHFQQVNFSLFSQIPPSTMFIMNSNIFCLQETQIIQKKLKQKEENEKKQQRYKLDIEMYMQKIKQLEQQNLKLKKENVFLQKDRRQRSFKIQQKVNHSGINYNFEKQVTPRTFTHDLEIQFSEIKLLKKIAEGGYGIIYKGEWKKTEVAVKIFKIDQHNTNSVKQFISECRAMEALRHPNIVMFLGACMKKPNFAIVLQYCEGGTLWSLLQNHRISLSWKQRIGLALETAKAMNYLHDRKNPIVHRDLKSLNILLDGNRRVKLADFGWTKSLENYMTSKIGTYQWMAPQVLTGQKYSQKADVFSYSIILWQIASRQPPYRNINGIQVAYDVANKQFRPSIPVGTPCSFQKLIVECWEKDPQKRPSFREIIEDLERQIRNQN